MLVANLPIGRDQSNPVVNGFAPKTFQRPSDTLFDNLADYVRFPSNGSQAPDLAATGFARTLMSARAPRLGFFLATRERLVYFLDGHQLREILVHHRSTDTPDHVPRRPIIAASNLTMDLKGANAFLGLSHQMDDLEPSPKRVVGVLEDRLGDNREAVPVAPAAALVLTNPVEGSGLERVDSSSGTAARAANPAGPSQIAGHRLAGFFGRILPHHHRERNVRLSRELLGRVLHDQEYALLADGCQAPHNLANENSDKERT
jgi:hypothetical protein